MTSSRDRPRCHFNGVSAAAGRLRVGFVGLADISTHCLTTVPLHAHPSTEVVAFVRCATSQQVNMKKHSNLAAAALC